MMTARFSQARAMRGWLGSAGVCCSLVLGAAGSAAGQIGASPCKPDDADVFRWTVIWASNQPVAAQTIVGKCKFWVPSIVETPLAGGKVKFDFKAFHKIGPHPLDLNPNPNVFLFSLTVATGAEMPYGINKSGSLKDTSVTHPLEPEIYGKHQDDYQLTWSRGNDALVSFTLDGQHTLAPEPASIVLVGSGLVALWGALRPRRRRNA